MKDEATRSSWDRLLAVESAAVSQREAVLDAVATAGSRAEASVALARLLDADAADTDQLLDLTLARFIPSTD